MQRTPEARASLAAILAAALVGLGAAAPGAVARDRRAQPTAEPEPRTTLAPGECTAYGDKLAPATAFLGDAVPVTLTFNATCADIVVPLHLVFVMDGSASMKGEKSLRMKDAAAALVTSLDLPRRPATRVAVIEFNTRARRLCELMSDEALLLRCIERVRTTRGKAIPSGLDEARRLVVEARARLSRFGAREVVLLFSDGRNDAACAPVMNIAAALKAEGLLAIMVCSDEDCERECMRRAATSARYFFDPDRFSELLRVFTRIWDGDGIARVIPLRVVVTDHLSPQMPLIWASADPRPMPTEAARGTLVWPIGYVPGDGFTFTYRVRPLELGQQPVGAGALADYRTNWSSAVRSLVYSEPHVLVLPRPSPVATQPPPPSPMPRPHGRGYLPSLANSM